MRSILLLCVLRASALWAQDTTSVSLLFVGDIMQHESQMKAAHDPATETYDYKTTFEGVRHLIGSADIAIGNLELTLGGRPYTGYPQFSAPDEFLPAIRDAGFDVLVTANNHSVDRGRSGLERTLRLLDSIGMKHTGTFVDTLEYLNEYPLMMERHNIRIALLNYTYGTNGIAVRPPNIVNMIDTVRIAKDLKKAAELGADISIVMYHWGDEYQSMPSAQQTRVAAFSLSHGAQIVIGSHPHVLQPMTWDKQADQVVVYSLGNFISGQRARYRNGGAMFHITLQKIRPIDGTTRIRIADASYSLAWVYRAADARKTFRLVPVEAGVDTVRVHGPVSRAMMQEFIDDSRAFLGRVNVGITEKAKAPQKK